ncbi:MAG: hypothetical protein ACLPN6_23370 [Streptosporangiaceae bacterium]
MVTITPELADRIAGVARLLLSDDNAEMPLQQLNAAAYQGCRQMVDNLRIALQSRAVIEQAKKSWWRITATRPIWHSGS